MVECAGFENRSARKGREGSNPSASVEHNRNIRLRRVRLEKARQMPIPGKQRQLRHKTHSIGNADGVWRHVVVHCRKGSPRSAQTRVDADRAIWRRSRIKWLIGRRGVKRSSLAWTLPVLIAALAPVAFCADPPPTLPSTQPAGNLAWSNSDTDTTPAGKVAFHGPFSNETINITLDQLPPHEYLEISFDFLAIRTLDGSVPMTNNRPVALGPDFFRLGIFQGPTLFYTTFSNRPDDPGFEERSKYQNYPSQVPGDHLLPQTGAREKNTLGYLYPWPGAPKPFPCDATYQIDFTIPHSDSKAVVQLTGMNLQNIVDESWGVANFKVRTLSADEVRHSSTEAIAAAFADSLKGDSDNLPGDFQTLILGMDATADWIKANVAPLPIDAQNAEQLVADLAADDTEIARRESAATALAGVGPEMEPYLRDVRNVAVGTFRQRVDWLLQSISDTEIFDERLRRVMLATRVLEIIGTPHAREVRRQLTQQE